MRLEEYFYEKVQGKRPVLQVDEGLLGQFMVQAGNQFDAGTPYGKSTCTACRVLQTCRDDVLGYKVTVSQDIMWMLLSVGQKNLFY